MRACRHLSARQTLGRGSATTHFAAKAKYLYVCVCVMLLYAVFYKYTRHFVLCYLFILLLFLALRQQLMISNMCATSYPLQNSFSFTKPFFVLFLFFLLLLCLLYPLLHPIVTIAKCSLLFNLKMAFGSLVDTDLLLT